MTHSLHRKGNIEELKFDYVVLVTPAVGINHEESKQKLLKIIDKIFELGPNNIGSYETGTIYSGATIEEIKEQLTAKPRVRCCFDDKEKVKLLIQYIIKENFGLSVTVSGLLEEIAEIAQELSIEAHSVNLSLGVFGKTDSLPKSEIVELVSLCGHGMVSATLVEALIDDVNHGRRTPEEAAKFMAGPCVCGIFNTTLAVMMLDRMCSRTE